MAADPDAIEHTIDALYGLPLSEFTPARDAAAKARRAEKDREGAERLRQLRKPNLVAWSINRARRAEPAAVDELISAGDRLQEAQRQLVSGGERGLLRDAAADERALVGRVAALAEAELAAAGRTADATTQSKLFATLHAAAADADIRAALAAGRLVRDHELSDLGLGLSPAANPAPRARPDPPTRSAPSTKPAPAAEPAPPTRAEQRRIRSVRDRLTRARERQAKLETDADQATGRLDEARTAAREAARALDRAEADVARVTAAAERNAASVSELETELSELTGEA